jgi:Fic family protein
MRLQVKQLMRAVQQGKNAELEKTTGRSKFADFTVQADPRSSFLAVLQRFRDLPRNMTLAEAVAENYHLCDYAFMQELHAEITNSLNSDNTEKVALVEDRQSAEAAVAHLRELQEAVTAVMAEKVGSAQARLEKVLRRGRPALMEAEIGMMVRRGR